MKIKKIFDHNILKINQNELLSINTRELNAILRILKNDKKQYFIKKNDFIFQTTKSTKSSKIITINHCKNIQIYSKRYNFYDKLSIFLICDNMSKHIFENVLIVKKINMSHMRNTTKYNIKNHQNRHEMKSRWILSRNYLNLKTQ